MIDREAFEAYAAHLGLFEAREPCFVYLMRCDRFVKVGIAANVEERRLRLQRTNPFEVTLGRKYSFGDRRYAFMTEQSAHKELAEFRVYGEWFDVGFDTAAATVQGIAEAARKLMRSRTLELRNNYAALWRQYLKDKALQAEVHAHDDRQLELHRKKLLMHQALDQFTASYRNGEFDSGRIDQPLSGASNGG